MCESKVFLINGKKKKVMDDAVLVKEEGNKIIVIGLLGEQEEIKGAKIVEINAERHEVFLKSLPMKNEPKPDL